MKRRNYLKGIFISAFSILGFALFYVIPFVVSIFQVRPEAVMAVTNSGSFSLAMLNTGKFFCIGIPLLFPLKGSDMFSQGLYNISLKLYPFHHNFFYYKVLPSVW